MYQKEGTILITVTWSMEEVVREEIERVFEGREDGGLG